MKRLRYENSPVDAIDGAILEALTKDARTSLARLARAIGLSAPSVAERIKRLEEAGIITGYAAQVSPAALGLGLAVLVRIRPMPGEMDRVAGIVRSVPEIVECDRVTGEDCFVTRAHVASVGDLEKLIDRLIPHAMTNTSIIQSSPVARRLPPIRAIKAIKAARPK